MRFQCQTIIIFALAVFVAVPVFGQDKKKGSNDSSFDVKKFLKRLDKNDNGMVEPSEVDRDRTRSFLKNAGADVSKPISIKSFTKKLKEEKKSKRDAKEGVTAQRSLGFAVADGERDESAGDSPGFAVLDEEKQTSEQARTREFSQGTKNMLDWVLRKYDRDGDGRIDEQEITLGRWADPPASESDTNNDGSLSRMELLIRYQNREDQQKEKSGAGSGRDDRDRSSRDRYGRDRYDRDRDRERLRSSSSSVKVSSSIKTGSSSSSSTGVRDVRKGYESYVDGIFKTNDRNSDGFLDDSELTKMRRRPDESADTNEDSKISKSELLESYLAKAEQSERSSSSKTSSKTSKKSSSRKSSTTSKSTTATSQLTPKDKNENGQIEMAEFETKWTLEKIEEFNAKDKNRDGVITKAEWETK